MRVLFSSIPARSHIAPMLPLVRSAVRVGHDVVFVTGAEGIPLVALPGVRAVELGSTWARATAWYDRLLGAHGPAQTDPDAAMLHFVVNLFGRYLAPRMAAGIIPFTATWRPDLVVSELGEFAGPTAALHGDIPFVVHGYGPQPSTAVLPAIDRVIADVQAPYDIDPVALGAWTTAPYLDVWPSVLGDGSAPLFSHTLPIRPAAAAAPQARDAVLDGLPFRRTVYVTLGSTFNAGAAGTAALDKLVSVFDGARLNAVVTVGGDGDVARFQRPTANIRVRRFVPQDAVIPYVDAVLSHAGAGTSLGALSHGIPHVMMPVASDQHRIGQRVADTGSGILLPPDASIDEIRTALHRVLAEESFAEAARSSAAVLRAMPDADEVLAQITPTGARTTRRAPRRERRAG